MADPDQGGPRTTTGRFAKGHTGNAHGRPRKSAIRADSTDLVQVPSQSAVSSQIRHDGYVNRVSGHGTNRDARTFTNFCPSVVTDDQARDLRRSEFICKGIIERMPEEAMRRGWHLKLEDKGLAEEVMAYTEDLGLDEYLVEAWQKEREAGGAALFPVVDGAQGDLSEPLEEGQIGTIKALHLLEPRELYPLEWHSDLTDREWSRPSLWQMSPMASGGAAWYGTQPIHSSRLIIFPGERSSRLVQFGQLPGWGDSALTPVQQVLNDFGLAWGSAATLLQRHGKETWAVEGLADMLRQKNGLEQFDRHVASSQLAWSVLRMNVIDAKGRIERSTGTLSGVHELLGEFKQLVAAAAETPVGILMGNASAALHTGDDDTRAWYATVQKRRKKRFLPQHRRGVMLCMMAGHSPTRGKVPKIWSIEYPPLWEPDEKAHAERLYVDMQRGALAVSSQIASADDVAESFYKGDTYSGDIVIDWERREAQAQLAQQDPTQIEQDPEAMDALGRGGQATADENLNDLHPDELAELADLQAEFGDDAEPSAAAERTDQADDLDDEDEGEITDAELAQLELDGQDDDVWE